MSPLHRIHEACDRLLVRALVPTHVVMSRKLYEETEECVRPTLLAHAPPGTCFTTLLVGGCLICPHDGVPDDYCEALAGKPFVPPMREVPNG